MTRANARRLRHWVVAVLTGVTLPVLLAAPALASVRNLDDGEVPGHIGTWTVIGEFVAVPIIGTALIVAMVVLPQMLRAPRYRPGRPWAAAPVWFGGPDDAEAALSRVRPGASAKGGAHAEW